MREVQSAHPKIDLKKAEGFICICTSCLYIVLLYTSYNAIRISTNARIEEKTVW